jgi:hypothetical protein
VRILREVFLKPMERFLYMTARVLKLLFGNIHRGIEIINLDNFGKLSMRTTLLK